MIVLHLIQMSREDRCRIGYGWGEGFAAEREVAGGFARERDTGQRRLGSSCS